MRGARGWVVVLGVAVACGTSCKKAPAPGGPCLGDRDWIDGLGVCTPDGRSFLWCGMDLRYAPFPCKGPKGCFGKGKGLMADVCDFTGAADKDVCPQSGGPRDEALCGPDGRSMVFCSEMATEAHPEHTFRWRLCGGGCTPGSGGKVTCDEGVAKDGASCDTWSTYQGRLYSCSADHASMLACTCEGEGCADEMHWKTYRACKGPGGCTLDGPRMAYCDGSVGDVGDPCGLGADHTVITCARDGKTKLECKDHKLAPSATCPHACKTTPITGGWNVDCN